MRSFITLIATWLFIFGFVGFFAISALLGFARDSDEVVATAHAAEVRENAVALTAELVAQELSRDPRLKLVPRAQIAAVIDGVIAPAWFDDTLRDAHSGLVHAVDSARGEGDAVIELGPTKRRLRGAFGDLKQRARSECEKLVGPKPCSDSAEAGRIVTSYQKAANAAIGRLPDEIDILDGIERALAEGQAKTGVATPVDAPTVRDWLTDVQRLRWLGLAVLIAGLVLIAVINSERWSRVFWSVGRALALASGVYLAISQLLPWAGPRWILPYLAELRARADITDRVDTIFAEGAQRLALELTARALSRAADVALVCFIAGVVLWIVGLLFKRR